MDTYGKFIIFHNCNKKAGQYEKQVLIEKSGTVENCFDSAYFTNFEFKSDIWTHVALTMQADFKSQFFVITKSHLHLKRGLMVDRGSARIACSLHEKSDFRVFGMRKVLSIFLPSERYRML